MNRLTRFKRSRLSHTYSNFASALGLLIGRRELGGILALPDCRRTIGNRHRERETAIDRRERVELSLRYDQRVRSVFEPWIVERVHVPERSLASLTLPEFLSRRPIFLGDHAPMLDEREHDDIAARIGNDGALAIFAIDGSAGINLKSDGCFAGNSPCLESLDPDRPKNLRGNLSPPTIRSGGNEKRSHPSPILPTGI